MGKARFTHLPISDKRTMVFPWAYKIFWGCSGFMMSGIGIAQFLFDLPKVHVYFGLGLLALGVTALAHACSGMRFRSELTPDGIRYQGLIRRTFVGWEDISSITWSELTKCFRLRGVDGGHIRISAGLTNLPEFARLILIEVPSTRIDGQSRYLLAGAAQGNPPSVMYGSDYVPLRDHHGD